MKLKSYYTKSVETALRLARTELGDQAVFLGSRPARGRQGASYEVTFGLLNDSTSSSSNALDRAPSDRIASQPGPLRTHWRQYVPASAASPNGGAQPLLESEGRHGAPAGHSNAESVVPEDMEDQSRVLEMAPREKGLDGGNEPSEQQRRRAAANAKPDPPESTTQDTGVPPEDSGRSDLRSLVRDKDQRPLQRNFAAPAAERASMFARSRTPLSDFMDHVATEMAELRSAVESLRVQPAPVFLPDSRLLSDPAVGEAYASLTANDVEPLLAGRLIADLQTSDEQGAARQELQSRLAARVKSLCRTVNALGRAQSNPRVVALVGPSGAGKTTALTKLALRFGGDDGLAVHILSADSQRVGAAEKLRSCAGFLKAPLTTVAEPADLPHALENLSRSCSTAPKLVLIDTPGYGGDEWSHAHELAKSFAQIETIDTHLVLSLTSGSRDHRKNWERFRIFEPRKLLFTKLDEATAYGSILSEMVRTNLPLSFFCTGRRMPEDLIPATEPYVTDLILERAWLG